jgi:hypothetical protein
MWKNIVERGRPQITIWRMRFACWITKATHTHTHTHTQREHVIIIALPQQQRLRERAAILCYTHTVCHVYKF